MTYITIVVEVFVLQWIPSKEIDICISQSTNANGNGMNPSIQPPVISK